MKIVDKFKNISDVPVKVFVDDVVVALFVSNKLIHFLTSYEWNYNVTSNSETILI